MCIDRQCDRVDVSEAKNEKGERGEIAGVTWWLTSSSFLSFFISFCVYGSAGRHIYKWMNDVAHYSHSFFQNSFCMFRKMAPNHHITDMMMMMMTWGWWNPPSTKYNTRKPKKPTQRKKEKAELISFTHRLSPPPPSQSPFTSHLNFLLSLWWFISISLPHLFFSLFLFSFLLVCREMQREKKKKERKKEKVGCEGADRTKSCTPATFIYTFSPTWFLLALNKAAAAASQLPNSPTQQPKKENKKRARKCRECKMLIRFSYQPERSCVKGAGEKGE